MFASSEIIAKNMRLDNGTAFTELPRHLRSTRVVFSEESVAFLRLCRDSVVESFKSVQKEIISFNYLTSLYVTPPLGSTAAILYPLFLSDANNKRNNRDT